jgi:uncharacterized membrane protein (UPF0136 family)
MRRMSRASTITGMMVAPILAILGFVLAQGEPWGIWIVGAMALLEIVFGIVHLRSRNISG